MPRSFSSLCSLFLEVSPGWLVLQGHKGYIAPECSAITSSFTFSNDWIGQNPFSCNYCFLVNNYWVFWMFPVSRYFIVVTYLTFFSSAQSWFHAGLIDVQGVSPYVCISGFMGLPWRFVLSYIAAMPLNYCFC